MPNKFTQIQSTPYVPQYSPPDMGVLQQAGQNLWKRQEQGLEQYDALHESLNKLDVLEEDSKLIEEKTREINSKLAQFSDANDFIEAQPAIRKAARDLQAEVSSGVLGKAVQNKKRATETFKAIEESDWSPQYKEAMKNLYLKEYGGAAKGDVLDVYTPPEYVDINEEIAKRVKELPDSSFDQLTSVQGPDGGMVKAKVSTKGKTGKQIAETVYDIMGVPRKGQSEISGNSQIRDVLITEAKLKGKDPAKYIQDKAATYALDMQESYGTQSTNISNVQWEGVKETSNFTGVRDVIGPGIAQGLTMIPEGSLGSYVAEIGMAKRKGDSIQYNSLMDGIASSLAPAIEKGVITQDDYNYFMNNLEKGKAGEFYLDYSKTEGNPLGSFVSSPSVNQKSKDPKFQQIYSKVEDFIDEQEGIVTTSFHLNNYDNKQEIRKAFQNMNPGNLTLMNDELAEDLDEKEKKQFIASILQKGEPQAIEVGTDSMQPFYRFSYDDDGTQRTVFLRENNTPNIKGAGFRTTFEEIVELGMREDPVAQQILANYKLNTVPENRGNVYEALPSSYKQMLGNNNYLSLKTTEGGGVKVEAGTEEEHEPVSKFDFLESVNYNFANKIKRDPVEAREDLRALENLINDSEMLNDIEKKTILDNMTKLDNVPTDILRTLRDEYGNQEYVFPNKVEAINFARQKAEKF